MTQHDGGTPQEPASSPTPRPTTEDFTPPDLAQRCLDSPGYLMFVAVLTGKTDADGHPIINFHYRKYHVSLEQAQMALAVMRKELLDDAEKFKQELSQEGG